MDNSRAVLAAAFAMAAFTLPCNARPSRAAVSAYDPYFAASFNLKTPDVWASATLAPADESMPCRMDPGSYCLDIVPPDALVTPSGRPGHHADGWWTITTRRVDNAESHVPQIPEPSMWALCGAGLLMVGCAIRRRR